MILYTHIYSMCYIASVVDLCNMYVYIYIWVVYGTHVYIEIWRFNTIWQHTYIVLNYLFIYSLYYYICIYIKKKYAYKTNVLYYIRIIWPMFIKFNTPIATASEGHSAPGRKQRWPRPGNRMHLTHSKAPIPRLHDLAQGIVGEDRWSIFGGAPGRQKKINKQEDWRLKSKQHGIYGWFMSNWYN